MQQDHIVTAPMSMDVESMYALWHETHTGRMDEFMDMMTHPSPERSAWLHEYTTHTVSWDGVCAIVEYSVESGER